MNNNQNKLFLLLISGIGIAIISLIFYKISRAYNEDKQRSKQKTWKDQEKKPEIPGAQKQIQQPNEPKTQIEQKQESIEITQEIIEDQNKPKTSEQANSQEYQEQSNHIKEWEENETGKKPEIIKNFDAMLNFFDPNTKKFDNKNALEFWNQLYGEVNNIKPKTQEGYIKEINKTKFITENNLIQNFFIGNLKSKDNNYYLSVLDCNNENHNIMNRAALKDYIVSNEEIQNKLLKNGGYFDQMSYVYYNSPYGFDEIFNKNPYQEKKFAHALIEIGGNDLHNSRITRMLESISINFFILQSSFQNEKDLDKEEKQNIKKFALYSLDFLNNISKFIEEFEKKNPKNESIKFWKDAQKKACNQAMQFFEYHKMNDKNFNDGIIKFIENFIKDGKIQSIGPKTMKEINILMNPELNQEQSISSP